MSTPEKRPSIRMSEVALALATRPASQPVTVVKTGTNAKGELVYREVSVAAHDPHEALRINIELTDALAAKYPAPVNGDELPKGVRPSTKPKREPTGLSNEVPF